MSRGLLLAPVIALGVAAGAVALVLLRDNGSTSSSTTTAASGATQRAKATAVSQVALRKLAATVEHPVFWLGPRPGTTYELTRTRSGQIFVRYLPAGVAVGAGKPYLTVATYPFPGAYAALRKTKAVEGAVTARLAHGGIAVLDSGYPESVHVAYPNVDYQVEVYDPTPARAIQLVSAGDLKAFGDLTATPAATQAPAGTPTVAATVPELKSLQARLGHPIYWAGPKPGYTYELTETSSGNVFIRYLPGGVAIRDPRADYLTVATYPFAGAYRALKKVAGDSATIALGHGGIGVVDKQYPKSIHLAYPGGAYQVEVFDPSPAAARRIVAAGRIQPVG
jgi:hypothetical protein